VLYKIAKRASKSGKNAVKSAEKIENMQYNFLNAHLKK
jgi:hypothetical protein